ncbi:DHHC zinc finger protein (macronuclear) [Tetrahymena thermophila SB210]|uniref:Palmitoyltransferase n=1 Tax=Tetrahymena thermophila (strain SB210) TaxID=312017 RepID=Q22RL1_TETTS|nr:DHHC zinc finger protein [Tetrahymena thermophila SB210]EAR88111.2 DHHC zinc finger protein [Tetrahymena thermophila SB210]|eukprot:XP_001008356.2 DHHC zinc finger protein [Tetrahymena thermophila SB210]
MPIYLLAQIKYMIYILQQTDKLAPVIYICLQLFILAPTVIRAKDDLFDFSQVFSYIFWISVVFTLVSYFITHCADPGYVPLELISLTENSQSSRIQQNGRRSFISQLFKGKSNANFMNEGADTNKINNSHHFKMDFKHTQNEDEEAKNRKQQKYLKNVIKSKKNNFVEFKDEEDHEGEEQNRNHINMDNMRDEKTPPKQDELHNTPNKEQNEEGNNNLENYIPECELTMEIEENKQKSVQKSFKFEDSCQSGEKQDFVVGLDNIQVKVAAFSPCLSRNRSFEKANQNDQQLPTIEEKVASIQVIGQELIQQDQQKELNPPTQLPNCRKHQSEKQISLPNSDFHTSNMFSSNSEKYISKETTTQIEDGSTKFTCKTTTQEQFTTQNLEKRTSPFHPFQQSEEAEDIQSPISNQNQDNQNNQLQQENKVEPFQYEVHHTDEVVQKNDHEKNYIFDKEQKNSNGDHIFTDNDNEEKSQRKMKIQTPVSQIVFTNNTVNNPSSMFQFNINNLQCEKHKFKQQNQGDQESYKDQWVNKGKHLSKSGDIENHSNQLKTFNPVNISKNMKINGQINQNQMPFVEKRYCTSCYINMPLRAKHCKDCKRCVARFDHHCPYVGNCIGEKNKCVFYWFLILQLIELLVGFIEVLKYNEFDQSDKLAYNIYTIFCFIIIAFFFIFVLLLFVYHSYFGSLNITTWEYASWEKISYLQDIPYGFGSPFSMGLAKNCRSFCTFRLFQKEVTDPQYVRYPQNLIELQNLRHDKEAQLQNENYFDLQSAKIDNNKQQKNNTD